MGYPRHLLLLPVLLSRHLILLASVYSIPTNIVSNHSRKSHDRVRTHHHCLHRRPQFLALCATQAQTYFMTSTSAITASANSSITSNALRIFVSEVATPGKPKKVLILIVAFVRVITRFKTTLALVRKPIVLATVEAIVGIEL